MGSASLGIHTSNRLEILAGHLAGVLAADPLPPLEREVVVVQSQGMSRWLALQLADRMGLAAGLTMPFPTAFLTTLAEHVEEGGDGWAGGDDPSQPESSSFDRELLTWRIFEHLPRALAAEAGVSGPASPAAYLSDDPDLLKRYQLSARLARLLDDYQIYRPELLAAWEASHAQDASAGIRSGPEAGWQARLWRALASPEAEQPTAEAPLARRWLRLRDALATATEASAGLPRRLTVFGVTTLPPLFLEIATALARFIPVRVYFTSPTYHYWGDVRSSHEAARLRRRLKSPRKLVEDDYLVQGSSLLAGLGRQGREFFNLLQEADAEGSAWHELELVDPGSGCLLHAIQSDVLHLVDRGGGQAPPLPLAAGDDSISIHACHSPRRELEILRDLLLDALARDPDLTPGDVLIMVPDIRAYSPYVEAVFGVEWEGTPPLPYAIADRRSSHERPTAEAALRILELVASRMAPSAILDLLETAAIRRAFDISAGDVPLLRRWIREAQIRWGMDGDQRARDFSLPEQSANSWRAGLDRLLMGYATGNPEQLVSGIAPSAGALVGDAELLGRLCDFVDTLFVHLRRLQSPRPPDDWADALGEMVDALFRADGEEEEAALELIRDALEVLTRARRQAGVGVDLSLPVVLSHLRQHLTDDRGSGTGFLSGRITVGALKPMRTLPFEVICIAGLTDGAFPRRDHRLSFDLIAREPRPGDRSLREDDRYLFLETLLSAGRRLILTYQGRSEKDNRRQSPSVVVSELLDEIDRAFVTEDGRLPREQIVVEHRLHPFSRDYYGAGDDPRRFSYSRENYRASRQLGGYQAARPFFGPRGPRDGAPEPENLPDPRPAEPGTLEIELPELTQLWLNPSRHYCRKTLGLAFDYEARETEEAEPFGVDALERYQTNQWLLARRLGAGEPDADAELALLRARGELPLAGLGAATYERLQDQVDRFVDTLPSFSPLEPMLVELEGEDWRLSGRIEDLTNAGLLRFRCANLKPKDLLRAWITHLARNAWDARDPSGLPLTTHVVSTDRSVRFGPVAEALEILEDLIAGYRQGLQRPLPVFESASFAYADQRRKLADPKSRSRTPPMAAARQAFHGRRLPGDADDPYVALCFRDLDPLADDAFRRWAEHLWAPLLARVEEIS